MSNEKYTINQIFEILRNNDRHEGVKLLYLYHYNKMYSIAFTFIPKEDICQDIIHNVIHKLLLLDLNKLPTRNELSWLYSVIKNEAMDHFRRTKSTVNIEDIYPIYEEKRISDFVDMDGYFSMIRGLNEAQKEIVTLKVLGGYTHKEISHMLGKPIGTVQWIYSMAVKKLKKLLISLMSLFVMSITGAIITIIKCVESMTSETNGSGDVVESQLNEFLFDLCLSSSIIFCLFVAICLISFFLIFVFSYKIPTKGDRKNV